MTARWFGGRLTVLGAALVIGAPLSIHAAEAARSKSGHHSGHAVPYAGGREFGSARVHYAHWGHAVAHWGGGRLQCVPFARENTGIELSGNAATWWAAAEGVYARGARPEVGSILNFRATGRMRMGHVAVVTNVVDARNIEIDQANWSGPGVGQSGISRNISVVDVSATNDWSAVRVGLGHTGDYGSVYPTYGFIYDRPDSGTMVANTGVTPGSVTPAVAAEAAAPAEAEEVAEAADDSTPRSAHRHSGRHYRLASRASVIRVHEHFGASRHHGRRARA